MWYTGRMQVSGTLVRGKSHTHNQIFEQMLMFTGPAEDIGLTKEFRPPHKPYQPVSTKSMGFASNVELRDYVLAKYRQSTSRIVCEVNTSYEVIDGYFWDRMVETGCTPWEFKASDVFTVIGFNGIPPGFTSPGPHMPHAMPPTIPVHLSFFFMYDAHDDESHFRTRIYTQDVEHTVVLETKFTMKALGQVYYGGEHSEAQFQRFFYACITAAVVGTLGVLLFGYMGISKLIKVD